MEFNEFFKNYVNYIDEFNTKCKETNHDPKIMAENAKILAGKLKQNLEDYEKGGNK